MPSFSKLCEPLACDVRHSTLMPMDLERRQRRLSFVLIWCYPGRERQHLMVLVCRSSSKGHPPVRHLALWNSSSPP